MKKLSLFKLLLSTTIANIISLPDSPETKCSCAQITSPQDCSQLSTCSWDPNLESCVPFQPLLPTYGYCAQKSPTDCAVDRACASVSGNCVPFTGCTAYALKTDQECQAISAQCFRSDSVKCLMRDHCHTYQLEQTCEVNSLGQYCFWNGTKCENADTCEKLPRLLLTDAECRAQIRTCTVKASTGGCKESGNTCEDQSNEQSCKWDRNQQKQCFWNFQELVCRELKCENAPKIYNTHELCGRFADNCTVNNENRGCMRYSLCNTYQTQSNCKMDVYKRACYWNGVQCINRVCASAPQTVATNAECQEFGKNCIARLGGGCVENGGCGAAMLEIACFEDILGQKCIWNRGKCLPRTCENALKQYNTHTLCESYNFSCTFDEYASMCVNKRCENAPNSITECEKYLPQSNCMPKPGGGCLTRTSCSSILLEKECTADQYKNPCFWHEGRCALKVCENYPAQHQIYNVQGCSKFDISCTANLSGTACVRRTCGIQTQQFCGDDADGNTCLWKPKCYTKECSNAPRTFKTHAECQAWKISCTVNETLAGCMEIPILCQFIRLEQQCRFARNGAPCGWNGTSCQIRSCATAEKARRDNRECNEYLKGCVLDNSGQGCMELPQRCNARLLQLNCEGNGCTWKNAKCVEVQVVQPPASLEIVQLCSSYKTEATCVVNSKGERCFYEQGVCRDSKCTDVPNTIAYDSHDECQGFMKKCTVADHIGANRCTSKPQNCWEMVFEQCYSTFGQQQCYWNGTQCKNADSKTDCLEVKLPIYSHINCNQIHASCTVNLASTQCIVKTCENIIILPTEQNCPSWLNTCVIDRLTSRCITIKGECKLYTQADCFKASSGYCFWNGFNCDSISSSTNCADVILPLFNTASCSKIAPHCTANNPQTKCIAKSCANFNGPSVTILNCQQWLPRCTANRNLSSCIETKSSCSDYKSEDDCYFTSQNMCVWNNGVCENKPADCAGLTLSFWTSENCTTLNQKCTINSQPQCITLACNNFAGPIYDNDKCDSHKAGCIANATKSQCEDRTCANFQGLWFSHAKCSAWLATCTSNREQTACIVQQATCAAYDSASCFKSAQGYCQMVGNACQFPGANPACSTISLPKFSHSICNEINNSCTVKRNLSGCMNIPGGNCASLGSYADCYKANSLVSCNFGSTGCQTLDLNADCLLIGLQNDQIISHEFCASLNQKCTSDENKDRCRLKTCQNIPQPVVSQQVCTEWLSECIYSQNKCIAKQCSNYSGIINHSSCASWINTCTSNREQTTCITIKPSCSDYTKADDCFRSSSGYCVFKNSQCQAKVSGQCSDIALSVFSHSLCNEIDNTCTVNRAQTACIAFVQKCSSILTKPDCFKAAEGFCLWTVKGNQYACDIAPSNCLLLDLAKYTHQNCNQVNNTCTVNQQLDSCEPVSCDNYNGNKFNHQMCFAWKSTCTVNRAQTKCIEIPNQCLGQSKESCFRAGINGTVKCNWNNILQQCQPLVAQGCSELTVATWNPLVCNELNPSCTRSLQSPCVDKTCQSYTGSSFTDNDCQLWLPFCTSNKSRTACVARAPNCSDFNEADCFRSVNGYCHWSAGMCRQVPPICEEIRPHQLADCPVLNPACFSGQSGCVTKSCSNKSQAPFTHQSCQDWLSSCTSNKNQTACIEMKSACSLYSDTNSCERSSAGRCFWNGVQCLDRECQHFIASQDVAHGDCESFLETCTLQRRGRCTDLRSQCDSYLKQDQCKVTSDGSVCYWMAHLPQPVCRTRICENLPNYTSHEQCQSALAQCTIQMLGVGCVEKRRCAEYTRQNQCHTDRFGQPCIWNVNLAVPVCSDLNCQTAPQNNQYSTHEQCMSYIPNRCTVAEGGSGCRDLSNTCEGYIIEKQCRVDAQGAVCTWFYDRCITKTCQTAPLTINSHSLCAAYFQGCTVSENGVGCILIPAECQFMKIQDQCRVTATGKQCVWDQGRCAEKKCSNAPATNAQECEAHLPECTMSILKCMEAICEDFPFPTDSECYKMNRRCTSDGQRCVTRSRCELAVNQAACTRDIDGRRCGWHYYAQVPFCTLQQCETAPANYSTERECQSYLGFCTVKSGGGCVPKSTCDKAQIEAACTYSANGEECYWLNQKCKVRECVDYFYSSREQCTAITRLNCVYGGEGRCMSFTDCKNYPNKLACFHGKDGPCLWVRNACHQFSGCTSIPWKTDAECKQISPHCTSNGTNCIPITECVSLPPAGCKKGLDGDCYLSSDQTCRPFAQCSDLKYLTHKLCNTANSSCTSDGRNGCTNLMKCSDYKTNEQCQINQEGFKRNNRNEIESTGICIWETKVFPQKCRDQSCQDFSGKTHQECFNQLNICTSNGLTCVLMNICQTYSSMSVCQTAKGIDGHCLWEQPLENYLQGTCRKMECADIDVSQEDIHCERTIDGCVTTGSACVLQKKCSEYTSEDHCRALGKDGPCVWMKGACSVLKSCSDYQQDYYACQKYQDVCFWNETTRFCENHTCQSKYMTTKECKFIMQKEGVTPCSFRLGECVATEAASLKGSECLINSALSYRWDSAESVCKACVQQVPDTTPNLVTTFSKLLLIGLIYFFF